MKYEREHYDIYKPELNVCRPCLYEEEKEGYVNKYNKIYRAENNDLIKQYRINTSQKMNEYQKQYYNENKDKINEKHTCECGGKFCKMSLSQHKRTKKHIKYIESQKKEVIITL